MNPVGFKMLVLAMIVAGIAIAGIYLLMLAVPQNDDEQLQDSISEPGHVRDDVFRKLAKLRRRFWG
jgi:uncharacterized membrane protein YdjX (TVP38/TMEM64 family)